MCEYINYEVLHHNTTRTEPLDLWKNEFLKYTRAKPIQNLHIISSTNFDNDSLAIAQSEERAQIKDLKNSGHRHIGRMFFPLRGRKSFYIIIDDGLFNNGWHALSTFAHEFTHAIDYRNFMTYASYKDHKYNYNIKEHPLYNIMYKWGEFHANYVQRIFSMLFLTIKYPKQYTRKYFRHYILQEEMHSSNSDLIKSFKDNKLPIIDLFIYLYIIDCLTLPCLKLLIRVHFHLSHNVLRLIN